MPDAILDRLAANAIRCSDWELRERRVIGGALPKGEHAHNPATFLGFDHDAEDVVCVGADLPFSDCIYFHPATADTSRIDDFDCG